MIRLISTADTPNFSGPLYIRVMSYLNSYGADFNFARFYLQYNEDNVTALISVVDDNATVVTGERADKDEISEFLSAIGAKSVLSDVALALDNGTELSAFCKHFEKADCVYSGFNFKKAYLLLLCLDESLNFDSWYVDLSHRLRHNGAVAVSTEDGCICAAKNGAQLLITGIAVSPDRRRIGIGKSLVESVVSIGEADCVWALTDEEDAKRFYLGSGFDEKNAVYYYKTEEENGTGIF